jgi:FMN-dependent NADH-azoreductase
VPDFLLLSRNEENQIDKVIIIETKGEGYAAKFKERKDFMEKEWIEKNNEKFGYKRFQFLYLEDTLTQEQRRQKTFEAIKEFFNM